MPYFFALGWSDLRYLSAFAGKSLFFVDQSLTNCFDELRALVNHSRINLNEASPRLYFGKCVG